MQELPVLTVSSTLASTCSSGHLGKSHSNSTRRFFVAAPGDFLNCTLYCSVRRMPFGKYLGQSESNETSSLLEFSYDEVSSEDLRSCSLAELNVHLKAQSSFSLQLCRREIYLHVVCRVPSSLFLRLRESLRQSGHERAKAVYLPR